MAIGDTFTRDGARQLADTIRNWWWSRGHAKVEIEIGYVHDPKELSQFRGGHWIIKSNLVNGLPPK